MPSRGFKLLISTSTAKPPPPTAGTHLSTTILMFFFNALNPRPLQYEFHSNESATFRVVPKLKISCAGFLFSSGILATNWQQRCGGGKPKKFSISTQQIALLKQARRQLLEVEVRHCMNTAPVSSGGHEQPVLLVSCMFTVQRSSAIVIYMKQGPTSSSLWMLNHF